MYRNRWSSYLISKYVTLDRWALVSSIVTSLLLSIPDSIWSTYLSRIIQCIPNILLYVRRYMYHPTALTFFHLFPFFFPFSSYYLLFGVRWGVRMISIYLFIFSIRFGPSLRYIELPIELITHTVLHELSSKCPNLTHMLLDFSTAMQLHDFSEMQAFPTKLRYMCICLSEVIFMEGFMRKIYNFINGLEVLHLIGR